MSELSTYRASIRRLIEAEDTIAAFKREGFNDGTAIIVEGSKSFRASRSASRDTLIKDHRPCGRMSHVQGARKLA